MGLKLGVDKQHTLFTHEYADIRESVRPLNHMDTPGNGDGAKLDIKETFGNLKGRRCSILGIDRLGAITAVALGLVQRRIGASDQF